MPHTTIRIAQDFSVYPGPRYRKDGPFSGDQFREELLAPALQKAIDSNGDVKVVLDGVSGYGSSFLDEAFAGLLRQGFAYKDVRRHLVVVAETPRFRHHEMRAKKYIEEEHARSS